MMAQICKKEKCTGCSACMNSCPKNAISMKPDKEGFCYPLINHELCVNCKKCVSVCPINHFDFDNETEPACLAVMASDNLRRNSSSGAFFPVLANYVLGNNGIVIGAAFDENLKLKHIAIADNTELDKLKGSKYLQSQLNDMFLQVRTALLQNKLVLFTGTPCQVAGLNNFLAKKYDNLITVDLICHGVPSQFIFDNYLESEFPGQSVKGINFRDKKQGWKSGYLVTITTAESNCSRNDSRDPFLQAFFANISLRNSCYDCKFTRMPRVGDFTMADFWGVPKEMDDDKGTSLIFINNRKAEKIFNEIKDDFIKVKKYPCSLPISIQPQLSRSVSKHPARKDFFELLSNNSLKNVLEKTIYDKRNIALLNFHWENVNFGALLTSYALNKYLNNIGYYARNIDYIPSFPWILEEAPNAYFDAFRKKNLPMTGRYYAGANLKELNDEFSTFIVGSDQVWRHEFIQKDKDVFFLNFVENNKKLISYAASFGSEKINASSIDIEDYKMRISLFDFVGVREESGVNICRELGVDAKQVCDPVFLLPTIDWIKLSDEGVCDAEKDDIVFYTINDELEEKIRKIIEVNQEKLGYKTIKNITFNTSVEEWLYRIRNCKFFVTDSFHGSCFAIIFNKPFVCINPNKTTSTRMESMFSTLGIKNRLYSNFEDVDIAQLLNEVIDYRIVNENILTFQKDGRDFLSMALEATIFREKEKEKIHLLHAEKIYHNALKRKSLTRFRYLKYKIFSKIFWGKRRKKYKIKRKEYNQLYKEIRVILKMKRGVK